MFVVIRFKVGESAQGEFAERLAAAVEVLSRQKGFVAARTGRNVDDPELLALSMEWENVGSYRRALSPYEVKMVAVPLLSQAVDEPTAYESLEPAHLP
ncbi:antibiotic biosynthesis monooxygenase [Kribbella sp. ALI-6-A]|uniref:antibiotic biosynthesis monooxygenase family protein n=1 Tax=Kribbella sp. ALI-6-A TaxID=1933817 RepID=UPI00097CB353|nr:antibiotic biosynthesis monooxygenase family protein [Kribbella sp. ALI-6-A]ONI76725.1 antibiotic biosynthesis monooxygenase [Kribbella sp. ALI-6-A]